MSYPVGVLTRQLVVRGSVELETGEGVVQVAKLVASRNLIWMSTNERLFTLGGEVLRGGASEPLIFQPPVTDQQGYRDKATGAIIDVSEENSHTHTYIVLMWCERDGKRVGSTWATTKPFALPTGDLSPVDVDTLVEVGIVDGVAVLVPDTWSARLDALEAGGVGSATRGLIITAVDVATIPAGDTLDNLAAYYNSAAAPITVAGVELGAGSHAVWVWVAGAWVLLSSGTHAPPVDLSDTTPPVWTATLTTGTPTETAVVIAASALATDNVAVTGYRWRLTGEGVGVARTITPSGLNFTLDGLTASTAYAAPIFWAVDAGGNKSAELTAQGFTTDAPAPGWTTVFLDTFTAPDGTLLSAHTPEQGSWAASSTAKIYGGKTRRQSVADGGTFEARGPLAGAVSKARITVDVDMTGATSSNSRIRIGFGASGTGSLWVGILGNGSISTLAINDHTFVETSGIATAFPTTGTIGVEADYVARTLTATLNGALLRSWDVTFDGNIGFITQAWIEIDTWVEDTAPTSIDNFKCEVWQ